MEKKSMTVAEFRERVCDTLAAYPDDTRVILGDGNLSIGRIKGRDSDRETGATFEVQIQINEEYEVTMEY